MTPRGVALAVLAVGILIGTLSDRVPERSSARAAGYWILAADFHVHAFPGDGSLAPWAIRDEARRAGLDVIALTNHNQVFTARIARRLAQQSQGPIVLTGEEITARRYHMAAIGVERVVKAHQPAAAAIAQVHAQGGVAIAAHPTPSFDGFDDVAMAALDGAEIALPSTDVDASEPNEFAAFFRRAERLKPRLAPIGSSDFHASPRLGSARTYVFARERTASSVLEAVRSGRTVAVDANGDFYGDASLVEVVERAAPAGRTDEHAAWRRVSTTLAWAGALAMLLLRGRRLT